MSHHFCGGVLVLRTWRAEDPFHFSSKELPVLQRNVLVHVSQLASLFFVSTHRLNEMSLVCRMQQNPQQASGWSGTDWNEQKTISLLVRVGLQRPQQARSQLPPNCGLVEELSGSPGAPKGGWTVRTSTGWEKCDIPERQHTTSSWLRPAYSMRHRVPSSPRKRRWFSTGQARRQPPAHATKTVRATEPPNSFGRASHSRLNSRHCCSAQC